MGKFAPRASLKGRTTFGTHRVEGGSRLFGWRTRYWSFLLKLAKKPTIVDNSGPTGPRNGTISLDQSAVLDSRRCADCRRFLMG